MSTATDIISDFSDYDELLEKIRETGRVSKYKVTASGNYEKIYTYPDMLEYLKKKVDPTHHQPIRVYAEYDYNNKYSYTIIGFPNFRYYFEFASGDKAFWMMIYIANKLGLLLYNTNLSDYKADDLKKLIGREFKRRNGGFLLRG
jgi:hypothetical protein